MKTFRAHAIDTKTAAEFTAQNAVIPAGHLARPSDNKSTFKIGDGESTYDSLPSFNADV